MDLRVGTPVAELKIRCVCYAEKEEINCTVTVINRYVYFRLDLCVRTQQMSGNLTVYVMQKREKY